MAVGHRAIQDVGVDDVDGGAESQRVDLVEYVGELDVHLSVVTYPM